MKIAITAPLIERVPPKKYGGTERVVYTLTEELVRRGHDVTLFASGDSITSAKLESGHPIALREALVADKALAPGLRQGISTAAGNPPTLHMLGRLFKRAHEFDIIHDHIDMATLPFAELCETPVVMTIHGNIAPEALPLYKEFKRPYQVAISKSLQAAQPPELNYAGVVYNGLSMEHYPFKEEPGKYLLFVGRICREKGTHLAIKVAKRLNLPLIIAAKIEQVEQDKRYYRELIKPELGGDITWIGEVDEAKRNELMAGALCLLHPITWPEPFGLTLIETMACGTPVVAFRKGSIPEIIEHGKTGFVVDKLNQMVGAVQQLGTIDRAYCREYALKTFNAQTMTDGYEAIYKKVIMDSQLKSGLHSSSVQKLRKPIT